MKKKLLSVLLCLCMVCMLLPTTALAAGNINDDSSLRTALQKSGTYTLTASVTCNSGDLELTAWKNLTINGNGYTITLGDANQLMIPSNSTLTLNNLTIDGGKRCIENKGTLNMQKVTLTEANLNGGKSYTHGAGLYNDESGKAVLTDCNICDNINSSEHGSGGGFYNTGTLIMENCAIVENQATGTLSSYGGGGYNYGTLYMNNCTVANNQSCSGAGGICQAGPESKTYLMNCTVTGNLTGDRGGGIYGGNGSLYAVNSVFAFNYNNSALQDIYCANDSNSNFYSCAYGNGSTDNGCIDLTGKAVTNLFNAADSNPTYDRPAVTEFTKGDFTSYGVYLKAGSALTSGGTTTYYDCDSANFTVNMSYGSENTPLVGLTAADNEDAVNTYQDGTTRAEGVIGALSSPPTHKHALCRTANCNLDHNGDSNNTNDHYNVAFTEWTDALAELQNGTGNTASNSLPKTAGNYYLTTDVTLSGISWWPKNDTVLCLNGHTIKTNNGFDAITVQSGATFTLTDCETGSAQGKITHDKGNNGRGVYVNSSGTFNMYGGSITGNTTASNGNGGGVYVGGGTFNMYGGSISRNNTKGSGGGGVYVASYGKFTMNGGTISGNNTEGSTIGIGGGVYVVSDGEFTMNGGTITGNTADSGGGGVYVVSGGNFTMTGGQITGNKTVSGGGVFSVGNFTMTGGTIGVTATGGANSAKKGGGVYVGTGGTFTMSGTASITGNEATTNGGGVYVDGGKFEMKGEATSVSNNTVSGNTADQGNGGGVYVEGGTFNMNDGAISGNKATNSKPDNTTYGGGVYVKSGTFNMSGKASITGNTAKNGGGVHVSGGKFNMNGNASIKSNTGNGVYVIRGTFTVAGAPTVTENTMNDDASNVFLAGGKTITIGGKLNEGASIGVTTGTAPINSTNVKFATSASETDISGYKNRFTPDAGSNYLVVYNEGDRALYLQAHQHSWSYDVSQDGKTITATCGNSCPTNYSETLTISAPEHDTYGDGKEAAAQLTYSNGGTTIGGETPTVQYKKQGESTSSNTAPTNAGTYTASITVGTEESAVTASVEYTIAQKSVTDPTIEVASGSTYDGTEKRPSVTVKDDGTTIDPGEYTVTYDNNINAGTNATVTVKDNDGGNYTLSEKHQTFTIAQRSITEAAASSIADQPYTGNQITPAVTLTYNGKTLVKDTDYTLTYGDNTNVGQGSITITAVADSNYTGTKTVNFNIVAKPGQVTISGDLDVTYGTEVPNVTINQYDSNGTTTVYYYTNAACTTGETTTKPTTAGDYWVKVKMAAAGNYGAAESNVIGFTISRKDIIPVVSITGWTYKDSANAPSVSGNTGNGSVTYAYKVKDANDDTYTSTVPTEAGDYTVKATVAQTTNYNGGSATADFKINPKDISGVTIADITAQTYNNGTAITPTPAVQDGDTTLTVGTDFTYDYENNINAGDSAVVKVNGQGNYTGTASKTFTISRADLTITVNITGWVVGGTSNAPSVTGNTGNGTVTYQYKVAEADDNTYTDAVPTAVGNYTVKATVAQTANYNAASATTDFSISTKAVQTITAENVTVTYGDSDQVVSGTTSGDGTISYSVKIGSEFVEVNSSTGALTIKKVGTATITVSAAETASYAAASKDITVTVARLAVTAPTADTTVFTYNGQNQAYGVTETANYTVSNGIQKNVGTYTVTVELRDKDNTVWVDSSDTADKTFGFEIKKATITIAAKNKSAYVNDAAPALGEGDYTVSGLATGENLKTLPTIAYASTPDMTKAGTVSITVSGAEAPDGGNYNDIVYVPGTLTISARPAPPSDSGSSYNPPTYKVESEVTESTDGNVSFSKGSAKKGDTVTITVTPDRYYKVDGVTVKDKNGKEIAVTDNGDGTFSFKMPASKVTVEPVFSWDNPFTDVAEDTYYTSAVEWALKNDITNGAGDDTTFGPDAECTRAQIVTFLWRAAGCPEPAGISSFTDVSADAYYAKAVAWAVEQGITNGTGDGTTFSPDATCTRSQGVTFLYRSAGSPEVSDDIAFNDVTTGSYYSDAVVWATQNGVTDGTGNSKFSPVRDCTRAQIVTFLYRWMVK